MVEGSAFLPVNNGRKRVERDIHLREMLDGGTKR